MERRVSRARRVSQIVLHDQLIELSKRIHAALIRSREVLSLKLVQAGRNTIDVLFRVLFLADDAVERLQVRLRLLQSGIQRSKTRTSRHEKVEIAQEDEREHEATAGKCRNFSHAEHLATPRNNKLTHARFINSG